MTKLSSVLTSEEDFESEVGKWFDNLGRFASRLLTEGVFLARQPKIIVLQVPSRAFVAAALNLGFSAQAQFSIRGAQTRLDLSQLESAKPGEMMQIRYEWQTEDRETGTILTRVVMTGKLHSYQTVRPGARFPSLTLDIGGVAKPASLSKNVTGVYAVDASIPSGIQVQEAPSAGIDIEEWGGFFSQQAPTCCTFTFLSDFETELNLQVTNHPLLDRYLNVPTLPIKQLARLDRLTEDKQVHFVNSYETLRKFQHSEEDVSQLAEPFQFVILDGNSAVANLVGNALLREKTKICIVDSGSHERLSDALAAIGQEAMHLTKNEKLVGLEVIDAELGLIAEVWV
jgi:hypothetical protein